MNLVKVDVMGGNLNFGGATMPVPRETAELADKAGQKVTVGVRPEDMDLVGEGQGLATVVNLVEELGADAYIYGTATVDGKPHDIIARVDGRKPPMKGDQIHLAPKQGHVHLFSTDTGERLPS